MRFQRSRAGGWGSPLHPLPGSTRSLWSAPFPTSSRRWKDGSKQLDRTPTDEAKIGVFVYYVQNGKAKDLADVLKQVFTSAKAKNDHFIHDALPARLNNTPPLRPRRQESVRPTPAPTAPGAPSTPGGEEGGIPTGEINIVVDETTNALIIRAYPRDYKFVLETIKKLDLYPKQVLIEVFLAEVTLDDTNKFGLEFSSLPGQFSKSGRPRINGPLEWEGHRRSIRRHLRPGSGMPLKRRISSQQRLMPRPDNDKTKIISSPHLLASNNKEAKIQVGTSQPILTNTYTTADDGHRHLASSKERSSTKTSELSSRLPPGSATAGWSRWISRSRTAT